MITAAFAPASIGNLGIGFDVLGLAVDGLGDTVVARSGPRGVRLTTVTGDGGQLSRDATENTAAIAARHVLDRVGARSGVDLELHKGLPIGSGLGSSAASAVAGAFAVNALLGDPLPLEELIGPCVEAEAAVSGRHADNVAPSLLGGLILVESVQPVRLWQLPVPADLEVVLVTPAFSLSTRRAREVLPDAIGLSTLVERTAALGALVAACYAGDTDAVCRTMSDRLIEPARAHLIPGCAEALASARAAGALTASISGAGPTLFALCRTGETAPVQRALVEAFAAAGLPSRAHVTRAFSPGARRVEAP